MLSTARQSCTRGLASWAQALPAESSRQALLRSFASRAALRSPLHAVSSGARREVHGKATYSAAAAVQLALEESHHPTSAYSRRLLVSEEQSERTNHDPDPRPPDPPSSTSPHPYQPTLTRLELFRALHTSRPIDALQLLCSFDSDELRSLPISEVQGLLLKLRALATHNPKALDETGEVLELGLSIIRDYFHDYPSRDPSTNGVYSVNQRFRGGHLISFLKTCLATRQIRLFRSTFRERARHQAETDDAVITPDPLVMRLSTLRLWHLVTSLFAPSNFPYRFYTPLLLERLMLASLATGDLESIPKLFGQHAVLGLHVTPDSYAHLTQAYLRLGDLVGAKEAARKAEENGKYDSEAQQMALFRGYKALGGNQHMEARLLEDLDSIGRLPSAGFLNAMIRIRWDAGDREGCLELLRRFSLDEAVSPEGKSAPNAETRLLAFEVYAGGTDMENLRSAWQSLVDRGEEITERYFIVLLRALHRLGHSEVSLEITQHALSNVYVPNWPVPTSFKPGVKSLNMLLDLTPRKEGLAGCKEILKIFTRHAIPMNGDTTSKILQFAKRDTTFTPAQLADLSTALTREMPDAKPKAAHLDLLVAHAIQSEGRGRVSPASRFPRSSKDDAQSAQAFQKAMHSIISSLRARGVRSSADSLRNRLRFDAYTSAQRKSIPSARETWASLLGRGFKPHRVHLTALMQGYADAGAMDECESMLSLAAELNYPPTSDMYMVLLVGWSRARNFDKAWEFYRAWVDLHGGRTDLIPASAIVQAAIRSRQYQTAVSLVKSELGGRKLDVPAATIAASAYRCTRQWKEAIEVIESVGPSLSTFVRKMVRDIRKYTLRLDVPDIPARCQALLVADDKARPRHTRRGTAERTSRRSLHLVEKRKARQLKTIRKRWSDKTRLRRRKEREAARAAVAAAGAGVTTDEHPGGEGPASWDVVPDYVPSIPRA